MKTHIARAFDVVLNSSALQYLGQKFWKLQSARIVDPHFFSSKHIFIVGCGHSGTSVLLARLDNHNRVTAIPGESRFFQLDPLRRSLVVRKWVRQWNRGSVLAEKTPIHVRYCSEIKRIFPNAKIIGICRHPLDTVASLYSRYDQLLEPCIDRWNRDNNFLVNEKDSGEIDYVVKYEDFVTTTDDVLREVQMACGLPVENDLSIVTHQKRNWYSRSTNRSRDTAPAQNHAQKREHQINQPIFDGRGKYRKVLSPSQINVVTSKTAEIATILGYTAPPK